MPPPEPPQRRPADDPEEWLNRARSNLAQARLGRAPEVYLEDLCFQAQQSAEKALKALLLCRRGTFPYVHDLGVLLDLLDEEGEDPTDRVRRAVRLNGYAVEGRYPGTAEPVEAEEYEEALNLASDVLAWVSKALAKDAEEDDEEDLPEATGADG